MSRRFAHGKHEGKAGRTDSAQKAGCKEYLTLDEAAERTKLSKRTLYKWVHTHKLPSILTGASSKAGSQTAPEPQYKIGCTSKKSPVRILSSDIDALMGENRIASALEVKEQAAALAVAREVGA